MTDLQIRKKLSRGTGHTVANRLFADAWRETIAFNRDFYERTGQAEAPERKLTAMATSATPEDERRCSPWPFPSPRPSPRGKGGLRSAPRATFMVKIADVARLTSVNRGTITRLYYETASRVELEVIEELCRVLECDVGDLFEYVPGAQASTGRSELEGDGAEG